VKCSGAGHEQGDRITIAQMERRMPYSDPLPKKDYEHELRRLQIELVKMQRWLREHRERVIVVFEGRDAAGKGGAIRRFTEHLNPRVARTVALPAPSDTQRTQWYFQRYVERLPAAGEIVLFDRSWYNRAGVERVMGFCSQQEYAQFFAQAPAFERALVQSGIRLFKLWFTVSKDEQLRRFEQRRADPLRQWKLSPMDAEASARFAAFGTARNVMLVHTDHPDAPWTIVNSNDKRRARLESIRHVLSQLPYYHKDHDVVTAPDRNVVRAAADVAIPSTKPPTA
jgi:polyphosphate kinase 2